ncbi:MAG TPA: tripartite tricarboxylate transporter substrate-binding protein [Xanthobacteraceae bacterium]|jgi:tripartite-type tricarboxylate transporter receptor subunit TctC
MSRIALCVSAIVAAATLNGIALAQGVADFYRGKTITLLIGYTSGGGYDLYARVLSRHMGRHIPGNPAIVPQNMPGAGSLRLANFLYNAAARDGTVIGMIGRGLAVEPLIGASATQYDGRKFTWLGSGSDQVSLCVTWHTSAVKTWDDMRAKPFSVAGEGSGSDPDMFAIMLKNLMGVKLRLVSGYPGGPEMNLAMERGEVDGRCGWSWTSIKITHPDWVANRRINLLVQMALKKNPDIPDVPLVMDLASNDRERQMLRLLLSRQQMGWPFLAPPEVPSERAQALRRAFDETMKDPEFLAEAKERQLEVNPMSGAAIDQLVSDLYQTPADAIAATKRVIAEGGR